MTSSKMYPAYVLMAKRLIMLLIMSSPLLFLQGCFENKPSSSHFKEQINSQLPKSFMISDIDIEAQENSGDSVHPRWKSRFTVTYKTTEPFYVKTGSDSLATFIRESHPKGYKFTVPFTSLSVLDSKGKWSSMLNAGASEEFNQLGQPASYWDGLVVREGNSADKSAYEVKVAEYNDKTLKRNAALKESKVIINDNQLANEAIRGHWKDRCNGKGGWAGSMYFYEDGRASWSPQASGMREGEYTLENGIITFTWYRNFGKRKTKSQWRVIILTKDHLEIAQRGIICVASRNDNERI